MAARKRTWTPQVVRERMRASALSRRLQKFALGEMDDQNKPIVMSPAQVTAALGILKKCVPDLSCVEHTGEMTHKHVKELSDEELVAIAAGSSPGAVAAQTGATKPPEFH